MERGMQTGGLGGGRSGERHADGGLGGGRSGERHADRGAGWREKWREACRQGGWVEGEVERGMQTGGKGWRETPRERVGERSWWWGGEWGICSEVREKKLACRKGLGGGGGQKNGMSSHIAAWVRNYTLPKYVL